jgi:hypothetical protein
MSTITDVPPVPAIMGKASPTSTVETNPVFVMAAAPARPGHIAEREELDAALRAGTPEALHLFVERHPESRYRPQAENALRAIELLPRQR